MASVPVLSSSASSTNDLSSGPFVGRAEPKKTAGKRDDNKTRAAWPGDDLSRQVFCILGVPIDALDMPATIRRLEDAAAGGTAYLLSTANLNFLVNSRSDPEFRESLLQSDLCVADGMPLIWISMLLGLPVRERIAGCDILDVLKRRPAGARPLTVFMFGGPVGVAAAASAAINAQKCALTAVGSMSPGFGSVEELSNKDIIDAINESNADFLIVALGALKGQAWLMRNQTALRVPIRSHLGAAVAIQAGSVKRAPGLVGKLGFEWLWRIKEEPQLWKRYWHDGRVLADLLVRRILPLAIQALLFAHGRKTGRLNIITSRDKNGVTFLISGAASQSDVDQAAECFRQGLASLPANVTLDMAATTFVDARFLGLLMMLRKQVGSRDARLIITGLSPKLARIFRLHEAEFLLEQRSV